MVSTICRDILKYGLKDRRGSCKTIEIRPPRIRRISDSGIPARFVLPRKTFPRVILPFFGSNLIIERHVTVFPQPDSPRRPTVVPRGKAKETLSTAVTVPSPVSNWVVRFSTCRTNIGSYYFPLHRITYTKKGVLPMPVYQVSGGYPCLTNRFSLLYLASMVVFP